MGITQPAAPRELVIPSQTQPITSKLPAKISQQMILMCADFSKTLTPMVPITDTTSVGGFDANNVKSIEVDLRDKQGAFYSCRNFENMTPNGASCQVTGSDDHY